jgi:hypothetical protein
MEDYEVSGIEPRFCESVPWNNKDVQWFGWNILGRQSSRDHPCTPYKKAKYLLFTYCITTSAASLAISQLGIFFSRSMLAV